MKERFVLRFWIILLLGVFFIGSVLAQSSSTEVEVNIEGCSFPFDGETVSLLPGVCSREGSSDGRFYCGYDTSLLSTMEEGLGCAEGNPDFVPGDSFCCPDLMKCVEVETDQFICQDRAGNCADYTVEGDCKDEGCVWAFGECSDGVRDFSCGYYDTETDCENDTWNLGTNGVGSEFCRERVDCGGKEFIISDCECGWYESSLADKCQIKFVAIESRYDSAMEPDKFECSNNYLLGDCIDGNQSVSWGSNSTPISGFGGGDVPQDCLAALNCDGGEDFRFCGEPLIKLPGFSLFSLFAAFGIIGMVYFFKSQLGMTLLSPEKSKI